MLIDSNLIIYSVQPEFDELREWLMEAMPKYSVISRVEVLGFHRFQANEKQALVKVLDNFEMLYLSSSCYELAISLKQQRKMSLGDALIAASCLEQGLTLATRNTDDFAWIDELNLVNPLL